MTDVNVENVLKAMRETIGNLAQENAILKASLELALTATPTTTAVPLQPNVNGPQGIQPSNP